MVQVTKLSKAQASCCRYSKQTPHLQNNVPTYDLQGEALLRGLDSSLSPKAFKATQVRILPTPEQPTVAHYYHTHIQTIPDWQEDLNQTRPEDTPPSQQHSSKFPHMTRSR